MSFIYFLTSIIATTLGSLAGLGGGVIIKPILDTLGHYSLSTVGVLSSFTVFSMALVSTYKQIRAGFKVESKMVILAIGSILGGGVGKKAFDIFLTLFDKETTGKGIQAIILACLLTVTLLKNHLPKFHIKNPTCVLLIGLLLGGIASFLGIGGGPINVAVLVMFMSLETKEAAVNSVFIILLSQFSKLFLITIGGGFAPYNLTMLPVMVIGGISGGLIGAKLNRQLTSKTIEKIFTFSVLSIILLNIYNAYVALI